MKQELEQPKFIKKARSKMEEPTGEIELEEETLLKETAKDAAEVITETKKELTLQDLPGVGPATVEKLNTVGFHDLMSVAVATPGEIIDATGIGEAAAKKLIATARACMNMGFTTGEEIMKKRQNMHKLIVGLPCFDTLLGGGFETGGITEIFSEYGGGKTQIGHILAVNSIKQEPDACVIFIDTENTFRPERIKQISEGAGLDPQEVLKRIKVARAYNSDHQMLLAEKIEDIIVKENLKVRLVVVDSLTSHFRAEFVGRGTLADRQQKLNRHMHVLSKLADRFNLCVYVTNQVMTRPDQFFGDPTEAIGGHIVAHNSQTRIYIRKGKKGSRVAKLVDSPHLPDGECNFYMTETGLKDV